jgi:putative transposase
MNLVKMETVMAYKYRIYPTKSQVSRLENQFSMCRHLYNWNLEERINAYKEHGETISYNQQQNALPGLKKERPWFKSVHSQVLQDVLRRLDRAYDAFFRRVKQGTQAPGFPRVKYFGEWNSITYPQYKERPAVDHIKVSKIGDIKIRYHRDIPNNTKIKTLTISKETGKWFACFSFEGIISNEPKLENYSRPLGIDMGLIDYWYDSDGYSVPAPKHLRQSEKKLKRLQAQLSRAKAQQDCPRVRKLQKALAKCHYRVKCRRNDFLHKTANDLLAKADLICFEDLKIQNMILRPQPKQDEETGAFLPNGASAKAGLNKSIADAGWGKFLSILKYKAHGLGKELIAVKPHFTSQKCSGCGEIVKKSLSVRTHKCPHCGLILNRDHNAAINILRLGLQSQSLSAQEAPTKAEGHPCGIAAA